MGVALGEGNGLSADNAKASGLPWPGLVAGHFLAETPENCETFETNGNTWPNRCQKCSCPRWESGPQGRRKRINKQPAAGRERLAGWLADWLATRQEQTGDKEQDTTNALKTQ